MKSSRSCCFGFLAAVFLAVSVAFSQTLTEGAVADQGRQEYRRQLSGLMTELRNAKTEDAHRTIYERIRKVREEYRAANPPKELSPAERDSQRQKMEEVLKKDPFRWQMYQLRQSMANAKTPEEREQIRNQMQVLSDRHAAEAEARLTPEQRAERQARQEKSARMQAELKPLMERNRAATTQEERRAIRTQMREILEKYR